MQKLGRVSKRNLLILLSLLVLVGFIFLFVLVSNRESAEKESTQEMTLVLTLPMSNPPAVTVDEAEKGQDVVFTSLALEAQTAPSELVLEQLDEQGKPFDPPRDVAILKDDGLGADVAGGDRRYTGSIGVESNVEAKRFFRVRAEHLGREVASDVATLHITNFSLAVTGEKDLQLISDPGLTQDVFANVILVGFDPKLSANEVRELVSSQGAKIVGFIPTFNLFELWVPGGDNAKRLQEMVDRFSELEEVTCAQLQSPARFAAFPDDPFFPSQNSDDSPTPHLGQIQFLDAAVSTRHTSSTPQSIAILDTGIQCQPPHPDLDIDLEHGAKCSNGECVSHGTCQGLHDQFDSPGHGTVVAGIAAARGHNGAGVAGVSWKNSKVIPIKLGTGPSPSRFCHGLEYALTTDAMVINYSAFTGSNPPNCIGSTIRDVVAAQDAVLVFPAIGENAEYFPGKFNERICNRHQSLCDTSCEVGGTPLPNVQGILKVGMLNRQGNYASRSTTGVDIAAPGFAFSTKKFSGDAPQYKAIGGSQPAESWAVPHVAGAAAYVLSLDPSLTPSEVECRLRQTAAPINRVTVKKLNLKKAVNPSSPSQ